MTDAEWNTQCDKLITQLLTAGLDVIDLRNRITTWIGLLGIDIGGL